MDPNDPNNSEYLRQLQIAQAQQAALQRQQQQQQLQQQQLLLPSNMATPPDGHPQDGQFNQGTPQGHIPHGLNQLISYGVQQAQQAANMVLSGMPNPNINSILGSNGMLAANTTILGSNAMMPGAGASNMFTKPEPSPVLPSNVLVGGLRQLDNSVAYQLQAPAPAAQEATTPETPAGPSTRRRRREESPAEEAPAESKPKRKCVSSACKPCRKRKSKCDGGMPHCSTCTAVYRTPCQYDIEGDHRRKGAYKRDFEQLKEKATPAMTLCKYLAKCGAETAKEAISIYQRGSVPADQLVDIFKSDNVAPARKAHEMATDDVCSSSRFYIAENGEFMLMGHSAMSFTNKMGFARRSQADIFTNKPKYKGLCSEMWTNVPVSDDHFCLFINLYSMWSHPFNILLYKPYFMNSLRGGETVYCSRFLVNAIAAYGCLYSDLPEARSDPEDETTAGDHFFAAAEQYLKEEGSEVSLVQVQGLAIMALREFHLDRMESAQHFLSLAVRKSHSLGLCVGLTEQEEEQIDDMYIIVRNVLIWGLYNLDSQLAMMMGVMPHFGRSSIYAPCNLPESAETWSYVSDELPKADGMVAVRTYKMAIKQLELGQIINEWLHLFNGRANMSKSFVSKSLVELCDWLSSLDDEFQANPENIWAIHTLTLLQQSAMIAIGKPYKDETFPMLESSCGEMAVFSARQITEIVNHILRQGSRFVIPVHAYGQLQGIFVYIISAQSTYPETLELLTRGISNLAIMAKYMPYARSCLATLRNLWSSSRFEITPDGYNILFGVQAPNQSLKPERISPPPPYAGGAIDPSQITNSSEYSAASFPGMGADGIKMSPGEQDFGFGNIPFNAGNQGFYTTSGGDAASNGLEDGNEIVEMTTGMAVAALDTDAEADDNMGDFLNFEDGETFTNDMFNDAE